jgi:4-amino-4-deoxy-L-arabinose transferase-like glycosyltransferase
VALIATLGVASSWHVFGHTWDEPEHIAAGLALIDHGRYQYDIQHPPLGRLLMALGPYLAGARSVGRPPPDGMPEGVAVLYGEGHYELYLTLARAAMLPFLWLLFAVTWLWARRTTESTCEALLAVALVASIPPVLGHAGLATLDVPAAATTLLALYVLQCWLERGGWRLTAALGLAGGFAVGTKLSAVPFLGLGLLVLALVQQIRPAAASASPARPRLRRRTGELAVATFLGTAVVVLAYGGRFVYLTDHAHRFSQALFYLFGTEGRAHDLAYALASRVPVPEAFALLVGGVEALTAHNEAGHASFMLGEVRTHGWWYFYLVALAAKTPLPTLLAGPVGLALLAREGWRRRAAWPLAAPALFIALLGFASFVSHINIGVRHVLVVYPLLAVGAAVAFGHFWRSARRLGAGRQALVRSLLVFAVAAQLATIASAHPDYLPYFNGLVRAPERVLVDSDLDWGQDLKRLERRLEELKVPSVSLAYLGTADLSREALPPYRLLAPGERATGWVAISALARVHGRGGYDWLNAYAPRERIGKSILLYELPSEPAPPTAPSP